MLDTYANRWALVTGASSGIGAEFAQRLAARGMHLVLVARREQRLHDLAADLHTRHGSQSVVLPGDLSQPGTVPYLREEFAGRGIEIDLLINNAGFAVVDSIEKTDVDRVLEMVRVNISAATELAYALLPGMLERQRGGVLNVASVSAYQPVAYMGGYAATKAYVLHLSEALWAECRDRGVTVTAVCPGVTQTEFFDVAGVGGWLRKRTAQTPEKVVKYALRAFEKRRPSTTTRWGDFWTSLAVRFLTRRFVVLESMKYFRPKPDDAAESSESPEQGSASDSSVPPPGQSKSA